LGRPCIFRILLTTDRLPDYQVNLPASNPRRVVSNWRFGLAEFPISAARIPSVPLRCSVRRPRGSSADPLAPRGRRERTTMEGAGQRSGDALRQTGVNGKSFGDLTQSRSSFEGKS